MAGRHPYSVNLLIVSAAFAFTASSARGGEQTFDDFFGTYFQRIEGITDGAGDAKDVNSASQIIDPWPPYVLDRRIPGNGSRLTGAIERYQDVRRLKESAPPLPADSNSSGGLAGGAAAR
jgi:hypothetical protein